MNSTCPTVIPGRQALSPWQKAGLNIVAHLQGKRDIVLAIDLTPSVNPNQEGRLHLHQIVEDSLQKGDLVYIVPFASTVESPALTQESAIQFKGKKQDIETVIQAIPFQSDPNLKNADIQRVESFVYQNLAQLNYCRLRDNKSIRYQSVVWITDAPVLTAPGIQSDVWPETPADSPFRGANSPESKERQQWIDALPHNKREREIPTEQNKSYKLVIVDLEPTVQEICTPGPGNKEICQVTPYLIKQLWLPTSVVLIVFLAGIIALKQWLSLQKKWRITVNYDDESYDKIRFDLRNNQRIPIGEEGANTINCPGSEIRAYLERKGNNLFLKPTQELPIYYQEQEVTKRIPLPETTIRLNCPNGRKDFEFVINIKK